MTYVKSEHSPVKEASSGDVAQSSFTDDAVRAAFPWVLIVMAASIIGVVVGMIVPAVEYHAQEDASARMAIACGVIAIVAAVVFIHLFVMFTANRRKDKV